MIAEREKMINQLTNAINLLHDRILSQNLTNEQLKAITILEGAYADLNNEYTNKTSRRNMQIKELKKCYALAVKEQENLRDTIDDMKKERF